MSATVAQELAELRRANAIGCGVARRRNQSAIGPSDRPRAPTPASGAGTTDTPPISCAALRRAATTSGGDVLNRLWPFCNMVASK